MIQEHPCKIVAMSTSKTGKHGGAKVHLVGVDIFTDKKHEPYTYLSATDGAYGSLARKGFVGAIFVQSCL